MHHPLPDGADGHDVPKQGERSAQPGGSVQLSTNRTRTCTGAGYPEAELPHRRSDLALGVRRYCDEQIKRGRLTAEEALALRDDMLACLARIYLTRHSEPPRE